MLAAVLQGPHTLVVQDVDEPHPAPDEVLVDVEVAGVCGSDVALFQAKRPAAYPLILGHEAIGRLVGDGRRVVVEPNIPCGTCPVCRRGKGNVCPRKRSLGLNSPGVFAERVAVPAAFVHPVPDAIGPLDAVGIEPLAVAVHAVAVGTLAPAQPVAVIGCGTEGLLLVQVAAAVGARVLAADVRPERLHLARRLAADGTLLLPSGDGAAGEALDRVREEWSPSVVFEAAGSAAAVDAALRMVVNGGSVVLLGLAASAVDVVPLRFVRRGLSLLGSLIYDHPDDFRHTLDLIRSGRVQPSALVSHVSCLAETASVLHAMAAGRPGKTVLDVAGVLRTDSNRCEE